MRCGGSGTGLWVRGAIAAVVLGVGFTMGAPTAQADECPVLSFEPCEATAPPPTSTTSTSTTSTTALAQPSEAQACDQLLALVNSERVQRGLPPLRASADVAGIASSWSGSMATAGEISHNDVYFSDDTRHRLGARAMGENVARNVEIERAHESLMNSEHHRANILDRRFAVVGFGAVYRDGSWWVTEDFLQPRAATVRAHTAPSSVIVQRVAPTTSTSRAVAATDVEGGEVLAASSPPAQRPMAEHGAPAVEVSDATVLAGEELTNSTLGFAAAAVALLLLGAALALRPTRTNATRYPIS